MKTGTLFIMIPWIIFLRKKKKAPSLSSDRTKPSLSAVWKRIL